MFSLSGPTPGVRTNPPTHVPSVSNTSHAKSFRAQHCTHSVCTAIQACHKIYKNTKIRKYSGAQMREHPKSTDVAKRPKGQKADIGVTKDGPANVFYEHS
jgi:hypothetical protein